MVIDPHGHTVLEAIDNAFTGGVGSDAEAAKPVIEISGVPDGIGIVIYLIEQVFAQDIRYFYFDGVAGQLGGKVSIREDRHGLAAEGTRAVERDAGIAIKSILLVGQIVIIIETIGLEGLRNGRIPIIESFIDPHDEGDGIIARKGSDGRKGG